MVFRPDFIKTHLIWRPENQLRGLMQMETKSKENSKTGKAVKQKLDLIQTTNQPYMLIRYKTHMFKVTEVNQSSKGAFFKSLFSVFFSGRML